VNDGFEGMKAKEGLLEKVQHSETRVKVQKPNSMDPDVTCRIV